MKRIKRHNIKSERVEASHSRETEEHDLAYYIHDRVELMHEVFSVLKYKELKAMAPESVRNLPIGDLQELCTEELLGISSKRLLAILDDCDPPSDTESSSSSPSPEQFETISLDSISSDEEILSQASKKKKHKHRNSKSKSKKKDKNKPKETKTNDENTEVSKASRAGLTVLELLELQARARAIRAQLQNEQAMKKAEVPTATDADDSDGDDDVEIKEESPDVVEISSGDEKPDINKLQAAVHKSPRANKEASKPKEIHKEKSMVRKSKEATNETPKQTDKPTEDKQTGDVEQTDNPVTKRVNDLIITVPRTKSTRKIKLNRNKATILTKTDSEPAIDKASTEQPIVVQASTNIDEGNESPDKKKKKKSKKKKNLEKDGSDHDEITLQLSDSEKMDLLEDLDRNNYQRLSSGSSDSESSSVSEPDTSKDTVEDKTGIGEAAAKKAINANDSSNLVSEKNQLIQESNTKTDGNDDKKDDDALESKNDDKYINADVPTLNTKEATEVEKECTQDNKKNETSVSTSNQIKESVHSNNETECTLSGSNETTTANVSEKKTKNSAETNNENVPDKEHPNEASDVTEKQLVEEKCTESKKSDNGEAEKSIEINKISDIPVINEDVEITEKESEDKVTGIDRRKDISEGELSDRDSSEVEALDVKPEVVCISDEETHKKKKKKKDKKAKKAKKSKNPKQDFRDGADQNFFKDANDDNIDEDGIAIDLTDEDVHEILELSDDSSCYEVEGTVLSKEPTVEEIAALSAAIDDIKKEDIEPTTKTPPEEQTKSDESDAEIEQMSWKDRYLDSKKVKRVLTTANILNALRKKNKELKKKMDDKKKELALLEEKPLEEGSIEHYQTLQGSTKFVDPVVGNTNNVTEGQEASEEVTKQDENNDETVTREMKKDAKQLLKIYKKLMNNKKVKRREKKKKRKDKKKEAGDVDTTVE